jgi:hypothetical protein
LAASRGSHHDEVYATFFEAFPRETIPSHLLDLVPVLTQIAGSLLLGRKFRPQTAGLADISVSNLEKDRLGAFFELGFHGRNPH